MRLMVCRNGSSATMVWISCAARCSSPSSGFPANTGPSGTQMQLHSSALQTALQRNVRMCNRKSGHEAVATCRSLELVASASLPQHLLPLSSRRQLETSPASISWSSESSASNYSHGAERSFMRRVQQRQMRARNWFVALRASPPTKVGHIGRLRGLPDLVTVACMICSASSLSHVPQCSQGSAAKQCAGLGGTPCAAEPHGRPARSRGRS